MRSGHSDFDNKETYYCPLHENKMYKCKDFANLTVGLLPQPEDYNKDPPSPTLKSTTNSPTQVFLSFHQLKNKR